MKTVPGPGPGMSWGLLEVNARKLEHRFRMIHAEIPSTFKA